MSGFAFQEAPGKVAFRMPPNRTKVVASTAPATKAEALSEAVNDSAIPSSFDARQKWPSLIGPVLNQGQCGSCYLFASSEVLMDRMMIALSKPVFGSVSLSQQFAVNCFSDQGQDPGCNGGVIQDAMQWMSSNPIPQGAPAYTAVQSKCPGAAQVPKWFGNGPYSVISSSSSSASDQKADMQREIMVNGPVAAAIIVYNDFQTWWTSSASSGIYKPANTNQSNIDGGHAIKIIGWGEQDGSPYWLIQNSWGPTGGIGNSGVYMLYDSTGPEGSGIYTGVVAMHIDSSSAQSQESANAGKIPYPDPLVDEFLYGKTLYWILGVVVLFVLFAIWWSWKK